MLLNAPSCPECESRKTQWLPATSDGAFVDYFRCDTCGTVWVVGGEHPAQSHQITATRKAHSGLMFLFVDIEAGLLFANMAQSTHDHERRRQLHRKAQTAFDAVTKFQSRVEMSDHERAKVAHGLSTLSAAIRKINSK